MVDTSNRPAPRGTAALPALAADDTTAARIASYLEAARGAFAPATERAIRADTRIFARWVQDTDGSTALPLSPETVAAFVDAMAEGRKPATVSRYVASLNHLHRAAGYPTPGSAEAVRLALRRMRRAKGTTQDQAPGLSRYILEDALQDLDANPSDLLARRDATLLALAYDTFARSAELVALDVRHVQRDAHGSSIFIRQSKTDQEGQGMRRFVGRDTYARLRGWIAVKGLGPADALFPPIGANAKNKRISTRDVRRIFNKRLGRDEAGRYYSGHSARVGATQDALAADLSTASVAQAGGWSSERMVLRYGANLLAQRSAAAHLARLQGRA